MPIRNEDTYVAELNMAKEKEKREIEGDEDAPKEEKNSGNKKKTILLVSIGLFVLVLGIAVPVFMMGGGHNAAAKEELDVDMPIVLKVAKLDPFIVNLNDAKTFLKVSMLIEYDHSIIQKVEESRASGNHEGGGGSGGHGGGETESGLLPPILKEREPAIRDAVIRVLSAKRSEEVLTVEGKKALKEELIEAINDAIAFDEPPVTEIFFVEYIIQ